MADVEERPGCAIRTRADTCRSRGGSAGAAAAEPGGEVGISLAWGGGTTLFGSHAVGILGDFVVWYGAKSDATVLREDKDDAGKKIIVSRFGDYLHVRLAHPDTRYFGAFGYSVLKDAAVVAPRRGKYVYSYTEFGRPLLPGPVVK